jgi:hypothetical protein
VGGKAELRAVVAGADRLVGVRVDAERDAHEHVRHPRGRPRARPRRRIEDDRRAARRGRAQERLVLVVAVDDEPLPVEPRPAREGELALGCDVGADALLVQQPEQRDVRERLRAEEDAAVVSERGAECARVRAHRLLAQHDERRPVLLGERLGVSPPSASEAPSRAAESGNSASIGRSCLLA